MKIYIAGKVTGVDKGELNVKFAAASIHLKKQGHETFVPCVLPDYPEVPHSDYMHICYAMIDVCDAVYMLADWQQSKGARMELQYAADHNKKILYQDESTKDPNYPIVYGHPNHVQDLGSGKFKGLEKQ